MTNTQSFKLVSEKEIHEINSIARLYRHNKTGAQILSLENDDENKVFGITFRTPPQDSTGIAHIMEHAVLCGSDKYPLKEPFIELEKGSLRTFLNAFTFPDKTCYPVASQNLQDFYNLIDVYVDAVFHPLIPEYTLQQEGWHYELDDLENPLVNKGVVFNEMKGAYSSPDGTLARVSRQSLYPDTTYGVDSGGDPREIPNLTYEQFKDFHDRYYHPSNAYIYFYGDDEPEERLRIMEAYLDGFNSLEVDSVIQAQAAMDESGTLVVPYDPGESDEANKAFVTVNWLIPMDNTDDGIFSAEKAMAWSILSHILVGTQASPLRRALIDSELGEDITGVGFDGQLRQPYFSTGLKGIPVDSNGKNNQAVESVRALIFDTLQSVVDTGLDPDTIEAAMNTAEFRLRENNTGSFPRGLLIMLRALTTWLYDGDPMSRLAYEVPLQAIKNRVEAGTPFFEDLIKMDLLENEHSTTVFLLPETGLQARLDSAELERLNEIRNEMNENDLELVVENTARLKEIQETPDLPEALAKIPRLDLDDLERDVRQIPLEIYRSDSYEILYHDLFTNGIVYLDLGLNLHLLPQDLLSYVPLFSRSLFEIGTESEDFVKLSQRIGRTTGGIYPASYTSSIHGKNNSAAWLFLRGKATMPQTADMLAILRDILLTLRLDNQDRFRQMVMEEKASLEASFVPAGHRYVNSRIRASFNEADWLSEQMGGISYLFFLRELIQQVDNDWDKVYQNLERVRSCLINRSAMIINVTLDGKNWRKFQPDLENFASDLPAGNIESPIWVREQSHSSVGFTIPAQVNYVGKGADLYSLGFKADGSLSVINNYIRTTWLWERVRVQGGAYGGFCSFNFKSGVYTFLSYRDPNLLETLGVYDQTGSYLRALDDINLSQDELSKTIIGVIGDMDAYQLPDAKGYTSLVRYLAGDSDRLRQERRDAVLGTSISDFHNFADVLDRLRDTGSVVVMGSTDSIRTANSELGGKLHLVPVL